MSKTFRKLKKRLGQGITFMIIPNSSGTVRNFSVPFPVLLAIAGVIIFNILIFALFTSQIRQITQFRHQIWKKDQQIARLKKEQKAIGSALDKSYQMAKELSRLKNERMQLINTWESIQRKGGRLGVTANRGVIVRTHGYDIKDVTDSESDRTPLKQLDNNLNQIEGFINQESNAQQRLLSELRSYDIKLDHMPSIWPVVTRRITSWFGNRFHPLTHRYIQHSGVDIKASYGSKVYAAGDGVVTFTGYKSGYGYTVMINHGYGYQTLYGHNSKIVAKKGQKVKKGDVICYSGNSGTSTGPHLHYEVLVDGDPVNPVLFLRK